MSPAARNEAGKKKRRPRIGLVLGAGGITGFAYHSGALAALDRLTGWDPRTADVIVGTSAGSGFGAMLRGGVPVDEVLAHLLAAPSNPETMARLRVLSGREAGARSGFWFGPASPRLLLHEMSRPWRLRPSRLAASLTPNGRIPTDFVGDRVRKLHGTEWPDRQYWVCAVRLRDGERVVFGADDIPAGLGTGIGPGSGIDAGTAVEASSAIPGFFRPVSIGGERYIDGAVHSPTNADLVADMKLDLVVLLSPMSASCSSAMRSFDGFSRLTSAGHLKREVEELRKRGLDVLTLEPGADEVRTMGPINMDPTRMVPTVLQAGASTLQRLIAPAYADRLAVLREAAERTTSPPVVAYPSSTVPRAS